MKRYLRIVLSTVSMYVVSHIFVFLVLPIGLVLGVFNPASVQRLKPFFVKMLFRIVGKKVSISGLQHIEQHHRYLIISNYPSFYTAFVLMSLFPEAAFVAAAFISRIPVLGHFMRQNGVMFVDKKELKKTRQVMDEALEGDTLGSVIILPEGQRSPDGKIHPFKRGFVYLLRHSTLDLLPITLNGFYKLKPVNRVYMDPDTELEVLIHVPISNDKVKELSDRELIETVEGIIEAPYRQ